MSDGAFPPSPPPPPPVTPIVTGGRAWWQSWWLITALAVVLIVGAAALIASTTGGDADPPPADSGATGDTTADPPPADSGATGDTTADLPPADTLDTDGGDDGRDVPITPPPTAGDSGGPPTDTTPDAPPATEPPLPTVDEVDGAPVGARGDRLSPVPAGEIADIGDGWRLQVLDIVEDGTELVLAENQFNDPPRAGTKFTLVEIALGYYGVDDPSNAFVPSVSGVAAASVELDDDCGVTPDDFRGFADVFSGGVLRGTVCFVTTPADDGTVQLYATTGFDGPDVFLAATAPPAPPTPMPTLPGPQPGAAATPPRLDPIPLGTPADVGEGWTLTVTSPAVDLTDVVAAENQFNAPPPDGFRFVGIDVEYRFDGAGAASAFEVSTEMVGDRNVQLAKGCGVIPDPVDTFADVFAGGSIAGGLCYVAPIGDLGTLVLYTSTVFGEAPMFFSTGGGGSSVG